MTQLGKIFVILNLVISVILAGWAVAIYTNHVDWGVQKPSPERGPGIVTERSNRIKQLWGSLQPAETSWKTNRAELDRRERQRPLNQVWYASELNKLATSPQPLQSVVYRNGAVDLDKQQLGRPLMENAKDWAGKDLKSLQVYTQEYFNDYQEILKKRDDIVKLSKQHADITKQLEGEKGLEQRLKDERAKLERLQEEEKTLNDLATKTQTDAERLVRRYEQLQKRVKELGSQP